MGAGNITLDDIYKQNLNAQTAAQINPPMTTGGQSDLNNTLANYQAEAQRRQKQSEKWNMIGSIIQGAGILGNTINSIVQASRGKIPIEIGNPLIAGGQILGNLGASRAASANRNMLRGILSDPKLPLTRGQKSLVMGMASIDPSKAMETALDLNKLNWVQVYGLAVDPNVAPEVKAMADSMLDLFKKKPATSGGIGGGIGGGGGLFGSAPTKTTAPSSGIPEV